VPSPLPREKRLAEKTIYSRRRVLDQLITFLGHADAARLTMDDPARRKWSSDKSALRAKLFGMQTITP
jgi:hypothetical protein